MKLKKPSSVSSSAFRSKKWDELVKGRDFTEADAPILALLCSWYEVVEQCMEDITYGGGVQVAYQNERGDIGAMPQIGVMKQASAEIRQLNKQLGINDQHAPEEKEAGGATVFQLVSARRQKRVAGA